MNTDTIYDSLIIELTFNVGVNKKVLIVIVYRSQTEIK